MRGRPGRATRAGRTLWGVKGNTTKAEQNTKVSSVNKTLSGVGLAADYNVGLGCESHVSRIENGAESIAGVNGGQQ